MDLHVLRHGLAGVRDSGEYPNDAERPLTLKGGRRDGAPGEGDETRSASRWT